jgi:seipin
MKHRIITQSNRVQDKVLLPFRIVFSKPAQRAYLTSLLAICASLILLGVAIVAYLSFYWSYIPRLSFERTIHLQFDNVYHPSYSRHGTDSNANPYPYGFVTLSPDVVSAQRYDVTVELFLPRTQDNREAGNFMLEASMYAAGSLIDRVKEGIVPGLATEDNKLAVSRRSALLPYRSDLVESVHRLSQLHWYVLGWREEANKLTIPMFEGVEFARGWRNVPSTMKLEVQSTHRMQVYSVRALFKAQFRGLRWVMYNHRIISAVFLVSGFWTTEMVLAGLAWAAISLVFSPGSAQGRDGDIKQSSPAIKHEDDEDEGDLSVSDTERTFPTTSRQPRLKYESPTIKQEEGETRGAVPETTSRAMEADDEDEDGDFFADSGLGTSLDSSATRRDSVRRRRGRGGSRNLSR